MAWTGVKRLDSSDTNVSKYVFSNSDAVAEAVLYRYNSFEKRTVICCSTMSGCPMGCRFCGSGNYFVRNLSTAEIVGQIVHILDDRKIDTSKVEKLQFMFMSMGEPMLNFDKVATAIKILSFRYPNAALLISTSAPKVDFKELEELSAQIPQIGLQFSIHESTDEARNQLIPFKAKHTLQEKLLISGTDGSVQLADSLFSITVHTKATPPMKTPTGCASCFILIFGKPL